MAKAQKLPADPVQNTHAEEVAYTRQGRRYMECLNIIDRNNPDGSKGKSIWTKLGYGFENRDGSWNLELHAMPADMRIHMRNPRPRNLQVAA